MSDLVFFYGTLMTPFNRTTRARIDRHLEFRGQGTIAAALFDLGIYPAAVPTTDARVHGEVYRMNDPALVLSTLDDLEGYRPDDPETSLYTRMLVPVTLNEQVVHAWVYFYNAPLGRAPRISSGDYLEYLRQR